MQTTTNNTQAIRVLVVDDHDVVRRGLQACLIAFDDVEMVGSANDGLAALQACGRLEPDVVLMDIVMPVMDGIEATRRIRQDFVYTEVIALTSFKDREKVQGMLEAGACGYLLKDAPVDDLNHVIRRAVAGQATFSREVTACLVQQQPDVGKAAYDLNARELEILRLLIVGHNNRQISEQLNVSRATVKYYMSSILSKLGVTNRVEAAALAIREKIVSATQ